jgi:2'-5' RNA ligase
MPVLEIISMDEKQNLYFIALTPSQEVSNDIIGFKNDFADRFGSRAALKVIPHITLKTPFKLPVSEHLKLIQWFQNLYINLEAFNIELNNFGAFPNLHAPVVFVQPVISVALYSLQKEILRRFKILYPNLVQPTDLKFKPHMTVAYRDLGPEQFQQEWKEYKVKEYKALFEVKNFHLLQHDTRKWNIINTYSLPG